ncbi:MAG: PD40 domain-containing protein [Fimbriimonas ginsengisoli]|uniref:Tricorn protease homolog n=1 Tax=Fimbriimonas ginsengisoli TaxID=1005039 RepID=A0A931LVK1_FIMGI|nr:PD40 domain-containing protein [Fimbriimonas ginsengisoli]
MLAAVAIAALLQTSTAFDPGPNPLLMQHPTMNSTEIVFQFADDLWSVPRGGGDARRLTSALGVESSPYFSPDGKLVAFSGEYDGNKDVFVMPAEGGVPTRLTAHPAPDTVLGWTPDGKSVVFSSPMLSNTDLPRLFTVPVNGGFPKPLPFPSGSMASLSPDGQRVAYVPGIKWELAWKRYRGGQAYRIWLGEMSDSKVKEIPRKNWNDEQPMWVGDKVFYLSDRSGPVGLYSYDTTNGAEREEVKGEGFDIKSATAGPDGIVYAKLGSINILDFKTRATHQVPVEIHGDFTEVRANFKNLTPWLTAASLSPSGSRVVVTARGWVLTVPASKGDARLLDDVQGVHRRDATWSPDGRTIAYITDADGPQKLGLWDVATAMERRVALGDSPAYYDPPFSVAAPTWSPDSSKFAFTDNRNALWVVDVATGVNTKIDELLYADPTHGLAASWSPDSKWLAYSRDLDSHFNAIFLRSLESGKSTQITDGLSNADSPVFDRDGKHLYFFASTNVGQSSSWLDLSSLNNLNAESSVYAVVLSKDGANPLQPESDEETPKPAAEPPKPEPPRGDAPRPDAPKLEAPKADAPKPDAAKPSGLVTKVDLEGIESRIIALPMPAAGYDRLVAGPAGSFFALAHAKRANPFDVEPFDSVSKFSFTDRKVIPFTGGVVLFDTNADGSKVLIGRPGSLAVVPSAGPPAPGQGDVKLSGLVVKIEPRAEWERMFHEIWRNEKMLFYSPTLHGIDADAMDRRYAPFLKNIYSRNDLNYLFVDMLGELCIGHMFPGGGDIPHAKPVPGGLLGADYAFGNGHYKLARIYNGERWNPKLYAPLAQPGVNAKEGEYLLAIDGKDLVEAIDVYAALEAKAGKQVKIKLGPNADGRDSREVTVVPVPNEFALRQRAWAEDNRRTVEKLTGGRGGYVHVPDTGEGGWTEFNRYYYAQVGKDGMVVDERFNHGGLINDFMIHEMQKPFIAAFTPRYGKDWPTPGSSIFGPKVMLINAFAGSGGDMFPWLFRHEKVGPLIGKRTWGGLIASFGFPLPDGGRINSPDRAFYNVDTGKWDVENYGVDPDIDVELDPALWRQGRDAQLERAIDELNKRLANYKAPKLQHPPYPDKTKLDVRY